MNIKPALRGALEKPPSCGYGVLKAALQVEGADRPPEVTRWPYSVQKPNWAILHSTDDQVLMAGELLGGKMVIKVSPKIKLGGTLLNGSKIVDKMALDAHRWANSYPYQVEIEVGDPKWTGAGKGKGKGASKDGGKERERDRGKGGTSRSKGGGGQGNG